MGDNIKIIYRDVKEITILQKNFKRHATEEVEASIRRWGFIDPIGYNPQTGNAFDGNGRTEVVAAMHDAWLEDKTKPVPPRVQVKGNTWLVPTVDVDFSPEDEVAVAATLNELNRKGGYDEAMQLEILQELQGRDQLVGTGFDDTDITKLLKRFEDKPPAVDPNLAVAEATGADRVPVGTGVPTTAPISNIKQVTLLYNPEQHREFQELVVATSPLVNKDNTAETVLEVLRYARKNLKA